MVPLAYQWWNPSQHWHAIGAIGRIPNARIVQLVNRRKVRCLWHGDALEHQWRHSILLWFLEMRVCITVCMIFHNGRLSISVWHYYTSAHVFELEMFCLGWDATDMYFTHAKNNSDIAVARLKYCLQSEVFLDVIWKNNEVFSELLHLMY